jgi:carbon-monoxide dehydrogenase medium subunit
VAELARRHGDFAIAGAVCGVRADGGRITRAAIALIGMASVPVRARGAEQALADANVGQVDLAAVARDAVATLDPPSDAHGSAAYRRRAAAQMIVRALESALAEAREPDEPGAGALRTGAAPAGDPHSGDPHSGERA